AVAVAARPGGRDMPFAVIADLVQLELGLAPARGATARARVAPRLGRLLADGGGARLAAAQIVESLGLALALAAGGAWGAGIIAGLREGVALAVGAVRALRRPTAPRLTVVEDWHWLDEASAEVLSMYLATVAPGAELVVLTARPSVGGEAPAWPPT